MARDQLIRVALSAGSLLCAACAAHRPVGSVGTDTGGATGTSTGGGTGPGGTPGDGDGTGGAAGAVAGRTGTAGTQGTAGAAGAIGPGGASGMGGTAGSAAGGTAGTTPDSPIRVLVWNNDLGYSYQSRITAIPFLEMRGAVDNIQFDTTYAHTQVDFGGDTSFDASVFSDDGLDRYDVVLFLNPTGETFDDSQKDARRAALRDFIEKKGRGFVGTLSATDCYQNNSWPWYFDFIGANFSDFSNRDTPGTAQFAADAATHPILIEAHVPNPWNRKEAWVRFNRDPLTSPIPGVSILLTCHDQEMTTERPCAWVHEMPVDPAGSKQGRMFYAAFGFQASAFQEKEVMDLFIAGLKWAAHRLLSIRTSAGSSRGRYRLPRPDSDRPSASAPRSTRETTLAPGPSRARNLVGETAVTATRTHPEASGGSTSPVATSSSSPIRGRSAGPLGGGQRQPSWVRHVLAPYVDLQPRNLGKAPRITGGDGPPACERRCRDDEVVRADRHPRTGQARPNASVHASHDVIERQHH